MHIPSTSRVASHGDDHGTPPNSSVKLSVRPVTSVASAVTAAPVQPAAYADRWADSGCQEGCPASPETPMTVDSSRWSGRVRVLLLLTTVLAAFTVALWRDSLEAYASGIMRPTVEEGFFPGADGIRLFYRKVGTAPETMVYLHGGPMSMADGGYELDALAEGRTLIAFQQRSGGRSQLVSDPARLSAEYYVRDLEALQRHFGLKRVTLIGQSWGAMLAAMYAARHPESVERLLLLSPGPPSSAYWPQRTEKTNAAIGAAGAARIAELGQMMASAPDDCTAALCQEMMSLLFRAYLKDVSALGRMRVGYCDGSPASLRHEFLAADIAFASLGTFDFLPDLAKMQQPALIVEGADTQVPLEATRAWAAALPNGRLLLVPGAAHIVWLEGDVPALMRKLNLFLAGDWPEGAEVVRR